MPVLPNTRRERFAQALASGKTATDAYELAGLELVRVVRPLRYYVYLLIDPRDDKVFYVGKGKGRRAFVHTAEWLSGRVVNAPKFERIGAIQRAGLGVSATCFADNLSEGGAFDLERWLIRAIGKSALTNHSRGRESSHAKALAMVRDYTARQVPYCRWKERILPQLLPGDGSMTAAEFEAVYWDINGDLAETLARLENRPYRAFPPMKKPKLRVAA